MEKFNSDHLNCHINLFIEEIGRVQAKGYKLTEQKNVQFPGFMFSIDLILTRSNMRKNVKNTIPQICDFNLCLGLVALSCLLDTNRHRG